MTCIVGIARDGHVWMGSDSAAVSGLDMQICAEPKSFTNGEFLIGYTSSFRMGQLLRHVLSVPKIQEGQDQLHYMVTTFIQSVRDCLRVGGFMTKDRDADVGGDFLVGFRGRLFVVYSDFQVLEPMAGIAAVGCGASYALGSLDAPIEADPQHRIGVALSTAAKFSAGVSAPFHVSVQ